MNLLNEDRNKTNSFSKAAQNIIYYEITLQELLLEKTADGHRFFFAEFIKNSQTKFRPKKMKHIKHSAIFVLYYF